MLFKGQITIFTGQINVKWISVNKTDYAICIFPPFENCHCVGVLLLIILGSLRNQNGDAEDGSDKKRNLCFTYESCHTLKSLTLFIKTIAKVNPGHSGKCKIKSYTFCHCVVIQVHVRSPNNTKFDHFILLSYRG